MQDDRYYMVSIVHWPAEDADDPAAVKCYPETYEEAMLIACPWVEHGYNVVITTRKYEEEDDGEYVEIPLDTYQYIENLTTEQAGVVLRNIYAYFFNDAEPESGDDAIKSATEKIFKRIKEYAVNGE